MTSLNRSAIVVRPGLRFLEWLHWADPTSASVTLQDPRTDPSVYLVPENEKDFDGRIGLAKA